MPIIKFTQEDKMLAVKVEAGWYPLRVAQIRGPQASNSGKGINFFLEFEIVDGKYKGKVITNAYTSASKNSNQLGLMVWRPTAELMQVVAAVENIPTEQVSDEYELDRIKDRVIDGKVELITGEGGIDNTISTFLPHGKSATANKSPF